MNKRTTTGNESPYLVTFGIGLTLGVLAGLVGASRLNSRSPVERNWGKTFSLWSGLLTQKMGLVDAGFLMGKIREKYNSLYVQRPYLKQPALRKHLEEKILPGIALYQTLLETGSQEEALATVDVLFSAQMANSMERKQLMWLNVLPDPFMMLSKASQMQMAAAFPKEGWAMKVIVDNPNELGFDTTHCIYVDILLAYGLPELAPSFCKNDDYLMRDIPYVRFERSMTLGRGDPVCNFRYFRVTPKAA